MTPRQLNKGTELSCKIGSRRSEIESYEHKNTQFGAITLRHMCDSHYNCTFKLKPDQIKMIEDLVVATAKSNLEDLKQQFDKL